MARIISLEDVLKDQIKEINQLEMVTSFIQNKEELKDSLIQAQNDIEDLSIGVLGLKKDLEKMKEHNVSQRKLMALYQQLDDRIIHMTNNFPESLTQQLDRQEEKLNPIIKEKTPNSYKKPLAIVTNSDLTKCEPIITGDSIVKDCRKMLFKDPEDSYIIKELSDSEFSKIPKYMIGRQTLSTVNAFITTINQIMKFKYGILALGKVGARKKGELNLYLEFKKEESDLKAANQEGEIYFFNADDYERETNSKLDKTKLNLLTVLRHCKRIHEIRLGKNVKYRVITS
ncbi:hypothetical protein HCN44_002803 [Aphidius gifuensis]|uniref:SKA complex subunit 1 n=1 Tax=Aphidius gifuensis TaxID=684658 RepID=A0A834XQZ7_APHGI|nr:spindle and kinetochore-associated protein 1-like [Aphidius gifuensis]XP_044010878.1 spindle and kinetochore-associated protein 1-like [Aphidius gifuensis]KAF7991241.1 hypothetical protein HCN44_002803 [Aphidius gifuensis]